jgi:hypothetical protein
MRIPRTGRWITGVLTAVLLGGALVGVAQPSHAQSRASAWTSLGGNFGDVRSIQMGHNADGRLEIFVLDVLDSRGGGNLYHRWQLRGGGWSGWSFLLTDTTSFTVANEADGRLRVFDTTLDGRVRTIAQNGPDGGWGTWSTLATNVSRDTIAAGRDPWGRLHVFVLTGDGGHEVLQVSETEANGAWAPIQLVSEHFVRQGKTLHMAYNADGRPEVFLDFWNSGEVIHRWQWPSQGWSAWSSLGDPGTSGIEGGIASTSVVNQADGRMDVYVVGAGGWIRAFEQNGPNGGWSAGWRWIGQPINRRPAQTNLSSVTVARNADGRLELYATGLGGGNGGLGLWLDQDIQTSAGGTWPDAWIDASPPGLNSVDHLATTLDSGNRIWVFAPVRNAAGSTDVVYAAQPSPGRWS